MYVYIYNLNEYVIHERGNSSNDKRKKCANMTVQSLCESRSMNTYSYVMFR